MALVALRPTAVSLEREVPRLRLRAARRKKALPVSNEIKEEDEEDQSVQDTEKDDMCESQRAAIVSDTDSKKKRETSWLNMPSSNVTTN